MNKKNIFIVLGALAILALLIWAGLAWRDGRQADIVRSRDPGLNNQERQVFQERIDKANTDLAKTDLSADDRYKTYMSLSANLYALGQYEDARNVYDQAIALMPNNIAPLLEAAKLSVIMNDYEAAKQYYRKLIAIDPLNKQSYQSALDQLGR